MALSSLQRFILAARGVKSWNPEAAGNAIDYAFSILDRVAVGRTVFRIVYDPKKGRIHYRTKANPHIRYLDCKAFDYSCRTPVQVLPISDGKEGEITDRFSDYTFETNYELIRNSFAGTSFLEKIPDEVRQMIARYPESLPCKAP